MNRRYTAEKYYGIVEKLRSAMPDISLSSDIIVGFPGERSEDFEATMDMLRRVRYDAIFSFIYSPRKGTPAAEMTAAGTAIPAIMAETAAPAMTAETEAAREIPEMDQAKAVPMISQSWEGPIPQL
jgi:tRNA-2-methylthio-N6-dimethylallyladenosine synthase